MKYASLKLAEGVALNMELRETPREIPCSETDTVLAFAKFIVYEGGVADMWYIQTNIGKMGYGKDIMEAAQATLLKRYKVKKIYTDWGASTPAGRSVCLKTGFKRFGHLLIWEAKEQPETKGEKDESKD